MAKDDKISVRFVQDYEVQDEHRGTSKATVYKENKTYDMEPTTAFHFIRKGVAFDLAADENRRKAAAQQDAARDEAAASLAALRDAIGDDGLTDDQRSEIAGLSGVDLKARLAEVGIEVATGTRVDAMREALAGHVSGENAAAINGGE